MNALELIIGNKKYSSWSLRPWLAMKVFDIPFTETLARFDHTGDDPLKWNKHFRRFSPAGKVPVLKHGDLIVWDSLAILEYLAETFPERRLWPEDRNMRALARALSHEMHAAFPALRNECPMNMARRKDVLVVSAAAKKDIARIEAIWRERLETSGGPFLFGPFTIADAMFAPVVNRFEKYTLSSSDYVRIYTDAIKALPAWREWESDGASEPWICEIAEV